MTVVSETSETGPGQVSGREEFLRQQPTYWLKRAYLGARRVVESELRPYGLTLPQRDALLALCHSDGMSQGALQRALGIEQSSASRLIAGLGRRGLVEPRSDPRDRRNQWIEATGAGRTILATTPGASRVAGGIIAGALSPGEVSRLMSLLRRVSEAMEVAEASDRHGPAAAPTGRNNAPAAAPVLRDKETGSNRPDVDRAGEVQSLANAPSEPNSRR